MCVWALVFVRPEVLQLNTGLSLRAPVRGRSNLLTERDCFGALRAPRNDRLLKGLAGVRLFIAPVGFLGNLEDSQ